LKWTRHVFAYLRPGQFRNVDQANFADTTPLLPGRWW
jgi:hypothetical protein